MEKATLLDRLKQLVNEEDILSVNAEVNELKTAFQDIITEEERQRQIQLLDNGSEELDLPVSDPIKDAFFELYQTYRAKKTAFVSAQKLEQEGNLRQKIRLIDRLKTLITEEEKIGAAVASYKEIHEEWKQIGDIPRDKRQEVQNEYSKLVEGFFYNLKIYRELKDHDLKRNTQLKKEIVQKVQELAKHPSIKEVESVIKSLQNEFEEIGPVLNEEWEQLKQSYWDAVKAVYALIHKHYDERKEALKENIEKKRVLLEKVQTHVSNLTQLSSIKDWDKASNTLQQFQQDWKEIGFGTKKENDELWELFRKECDAFYAEKKNFYASLREKQQEFVDAKKKIIEKAHALKASTDWKNTTNQFLHLQETWKKTGHVSQKTEQVLWKEFREACDFFFDAKQAHYAQQDQSFKQNLDAKNALIAEIEAYSVPDDKQKALADLRNFAASFSGIGMVPMKEKDAVYNRYKAALDSHYGKLKLEGEEKEKAFFQAKLDTLKASPNAAQLIDKERRELAQKITKLQQDIIQFENNLGFFANSKGADALKKEVMHKIDQAKQRIEEYKQKMSMLKQ